MKFKRAAVLSFAFAAGTWLAAFASADMCQTPKNTTTPRVHVERPEDVIDEVPVLAKIPRSFLFGDGYKIKLGTTDLRVDHMGTHSQNPVSRRTCMIGLSYVTPVAGFFTSRFEMPLLDSPDLQLTDWSHSSLGDYVAYFSKGAQTTPSVQLVLTARFN